MKYLISLVALLAIGCGQSNDAPSGIDVNALDRSADPCMDFYRFACGGWIKANPIEGDATRAAKFYEPYYAMYPLLQKIIDDDAGGARASDDPYAALIGDYHNSCLAAPNDTASRDVLRGLLAKIDAVTTLDELARQVAAQREIGSSTFFQFYVSQDPGDATRYLAMIDEGGIELAYNDYYLDPQYKDVLTAYRAHIEAMSALIGGTPIDAAAVIRVETALVTAALHPSDAPSDPASQYHPMTPAAAAALAPTFPWQTFWSEAGFGGLKKVDVISPAYLTALETMFKSMPLEDLKSYLRWELLQDRSSGLDQPFLDEDFHFWSGFTGQAEAYPRWFTCFNTTLDSLGDAVARPYIARHFDEAATTATEAMFKKGQGAFARRLENAAWLDPATRSEALTKLAAIVEKIGHPTKAPDYEGLTLDPASFLGNELAFRKLWQARSRAKIDATVDRTEWITSPLTINAFYEWTVNGVTLPAALLAAPFLQAGRTDAANYGALGAVLGHEITHGFDDHGRHFDGNGTLRDWWTPAMAAGFAQRSQCIVDQFDAFEPLPGQHVNGTLTLGENIADLGGINIAYDALFDGDEDVVGGDGFDAQQIFFLSYAQLNCENVHPDLQSQGLLTDPHAPGQLRVNGPLSNLPAFREAFSCAEDGPMARVDACEVW